MSIFLRLREERERLRLSQTAFGELGGVQKRAQVNYENGERSPDANYLAAIAGYGVDIQYVLTGARTAPENVLPADEQALLRNYRSCTPEACVNLIQMSALLAAQMPVAGSAASPAPAPSPSQSQSQSGSVRVKKGFGVLAVGSIGGKK